MTSSTEHPDLTIVQQQPEQTLAVLLHLLTAAGEIRDIIGAGNRPDVYERARLGEAVDRGWTLLKMAPPPPASRINDLIRERILAAGLGDVPWGDMEPSPGLNGTIAGIAKLYRAVEYDAQDRPTERGAVIIAATRAGLLPIASDTITPRTIRGCTAPPATPDEIADLVKPFASIGRPVADVLADLVTANVVSPASAAHLAAEFGDPDAAGDAAVNAAVEAIRPVLASLFNGGRTVGRATAKATR